MPPPIQSKQTVTIETRLVVPFGSLNLLNIFKSHANLPFVLFLCVWTGNFHVIISEEEQCLHRKAYALKKTVGHKGVTGLQLCSSPFEVAEHNMSGNTAVPFLPSYFRVPLVYCSVTHTNPQMFMVQHSQLLERL